MIVLLFTLALVQPERCGAGAAHIAAASERAAAFDLPGAIARLGQAPVECPDTQVPLWYLRGLVAARDAYREGGSVESLEPVRRAMAALQAHTSVSRLAEIARVVLQAASAAAQSERDEMGVVLTHALQLERQQLGDASGWLILPVAEVAGDLWLQVHRFEEARQAYTEAARPRGSTGRVRLGLARVAVRLGELATACAEYGNLVTAWPFSTDPPEIIEARAFLSRPDCQARPPTPARP